MHVYIFKDVLIIYASQVHFYDSMFSNNNNKVLNKLNG